MSVINDITILGLSLRWHHPDQVQRVLLRPFFYVALEKGRPSAIKSADCNEKTKTKQTLLKTKQKFFSLKLRAEDSNFHLFVILAFYANCSLLRAFFLNSKLDQNHFDHAGYTFGLSTICVSNPEFTRHHQNHS